MLTDAAPADAADDVVAIPQQSLQKRTEEQVSTRADTVVANLKVYQVDLEVAALYILESTKLLVSFKLVSPPLRAYRQVHGRSVCTSTS
jgi:hypothetical protein